MKNLPLIAALSLVTACTTTTDVPVTTSAPADPCAAAFAKLVQIERARSARNLPLAGMFIGPTLPTFSEYQNQKRIVRECRRRNA